MTCITSTGGIGRARDSCLPVFSCSMDWSFWGFKNAALDSPMTAYGNDARGLHLAVGWAFLRGTKTAEAVLAWRAREAPS